MLYLIKNSNQTPTEPLLYTVHSGLSVYESSLERPNPPVNSDALKRKGKNT